MPTIIFPAPIFGPVHSRRLGVSLGINLMPPDGKVCTFDCIYCECGFNAQRRPTQRRPTRQAVADALEAQLKKMAAEGPRPDVLTFAGNGEPTAHPDFAGIIDDTLSLRDRLVSQYVDHVAGSGRGVVTALTLGDTSEIDRPTRDTYSQTGASHVLSLSGLHLSILFGVVKLLLLDRCSRRTTRTASHLLAIAGLWAFALLAGLPVSLVRSTAMYSILCLADMSQRPNASFNSLATAAFFILQCAPMALFDVSFQLSFLSVAAILLILPLLTPKPGTWLTRFLTSFVTLPVVAQIVVAPLVALYFQTIPLYFLVANLVAVPASTAILILAIPFFIVPADSAQDCIGQVMGWAAETMNAAMNAIASWPYAYVTFRPSTAGVVMAYATIVAATLWLVRRRRADAYLFIGCTTLTACTELVMHSPLVIK